MRIKFGLKHGVMLWHSKGTLTVLNRRVSPQDTSTERTGEDVWTPKKKLLL